MTIDTEDPQVQSTAALVNGIVGDLQYLVEQQFELTRLEIEDDLRRRAKAMAMFGLAIAVFFVDAILACLTLAQTLHWATSPVNTDPGWIPLWGCYAVLTTAMALVGATLWLIGQRRSKSLFPRLLRPHRISRSTTNGQKS